MNKKEATRLAKWLNSAPKKIKVGAFDVKLKFESDWLKATDGQNCWGQYNPMTLTATVGNMSGAPSQNFVAGTLLHEVIHAIWRSRLLGERVKEEEMTGNLEIGFIALIRDNPKFMPWLLEGIN